MIRFLAMSSKGLPIEFTISKEQARRFLLTHHRLLPPRKLTGKQGVLDYVRHVNCIQYDPINVVGQNPHLVLQSRVKGYRPAMLDEALYSDRKLVDGFDKVMSIYPVEDWPYFAGYREVMGKEYTGHTSTAKATKLLEWVRKELEERGPLSSLELEEDTRMQWWWGNNARAARIALDIMFISGEVIVHHRVGTRRYFDLSKRWLNGRPKEETHPHSSPESYKDWHVMRRIAAMGMIRPGGSSNQWVGIMRSKGGSLPTSLARLQGRGEVPRVDEQGVSGQDFFIRRVDLPELEKAAKRGSSKLSAAFLAPLDNLMWDRDLLEQLFDFFYRWEVYVPASKRQYGYYVLPVLYGDRLVARLDPAYDRASKRFTIQNWWWQSGVDKKNEAMLSALQDCVKDFVKYLGAREVKLGDAIKRDRLLKKVAETTY